MNIGSSILLGIVQGLTEFLPVSSSGHLGIFQAIVEDVSGYGLSEPVAFDVLLHLGTLLAVLFIYWRDIFALVPAFFTMLGRFFRGERKWSNYTVNERFVILLLITTGILVPSALIEHYLDALSGLVWVIGCILLLNGGLLLLSDRLGKGNRGIENATPKDGLRIGLFQFLALLPGLSRSGSTITGGLFSGFTREEAVRFSFVASVPAILGACVLKLPKLASETTDGRTWLIYLAGMVAAMVIGLLAMQLLRWISRKGNFRGFAFYCFAVGAAAIVYGILR